MKFDILHLWFLADPTRPKYVGELNRVQDGKGVSLRYGTEWLRSGFPLSENLPLVDIEHQPPGRIEAGKPMAVGAVDDARPDRWGERVIAYVDRPERKSLMEFLYFAGDDRHGALGVSDSAEAYRPKLGGPLPRLPEIGTVKEVVRKILDREPISEVERRMVAAGGSFGGAKPKALLEIEGEQWLVKFPNGEPVDLPLVEHATMALARKARIRTADTMILKANDEHAVAVRRFDRRKGLRIHVVSAGTALRAATAVESLSLGYPALARLLRRSGDTSGGMSAMDSAELFRRMVFNILMDNTDDHEKNHALLSLGTGTRRHYRLAPAYDVVPTGSGQGAQEFACGQDGQDSSLANAMSECSAFGLEPEDAARQIMEVIGVVDGWRKHFAECGVGTRDIEELAQSIDESYIGRQRARFDAMAFTGRRRRTSPKSGSFRPKGPG